MNTPRTPGRHGTRGDREISALYRQAPCNEPSDGVEAAILAASKRPAPGRIRRGCWRGIEKLVEGGDIDAARQALDRLRARFPDHPVKADLLRRLASP